MRWGDTVNALEIVKEELFLKMPHQTHRSFRSGNQEATRKYYDFGKLIDITWKSLCE